MVKDMDKTLRSKQSLSKLIKKNKSYFMFFNFQHKIRVRCFCYLYNKFIVHVVELVVL